MREKIENYSEKIVQIENDYEVLYNENEQNKNEI